MSQYDSIDSILSRSQVKLLTGSVTPQYSTGVSATGVGQSTFSTSFLQEITIKMMQENNRSFFIIC
jgi:hypothetical protein